MESKSLASVILSLRVETGLLEESHTVTSLLSFSDLTIKFSTQDAVAILCLKMDLKTTVVKLATGTASSGQPRKTVNQTL